MKEKLKKLWYKYVTKETILYVVFGVLTTCVNFAIFYTLKYTVQIHIQIINAIAIIASIIFAYVTNRIFVFESKVTSFKGICKEMAMFFSARAITFALEIGIMYIVPLILTNNGMLKETSEDIAKLVAQVIVLVTNYALSKLLVFRKKKNDSEQNVD